MPKYRILAAVALLPLGLSACGSDDSAGGGGARTIKISVTDAGCIPTKIAAAPGATTFVVTNGGATRVHEYEIFDGTRILGEAENIDATTKGQFTVNLKPGRYKTLCRGSSEPIGALTVKGAAPAQAADAQLAAATRGYTSYVEAQAAELRKRVGTFAAAVKAGDTAKAKSLFAGARFPYEKIEPVAESFGNLDPEIDARVNDVAEGDRWTGFHRIEQGLWRKGSTAGLSPFADKLVKDVDRLVRKVKGLAYEPEELANGATGLLGEVSKSKITGEEDRYSHTDLSDFEANVLGSQAAFNLLVPALRRQDAALASTIQRRFKSVLAGLEPYRSATGFVSYETVGQADRRKLSQLVDALAEPLSRVAGKLRA